VQSDHVSDSKLANLIHLNPTENQFRPFSVLVILEIFSVYILLNLQFETVGENPVL